MSKGCGVTFGINHTHLLVTTKVQDRLCGLVDQVVAGFGEGGVTFPRAFGAGFAGFVSELAPSSFDCFFSATSALP